MEVHIGFQTCNLQKVFNEIFQCKSHRQTLVGVCSHLIIRGDYVIITIDIWWTDQVFAFNCNCNLVKMLCFSFYIWHNMDKISDNARCLVQWQCTSELGLICIISRPVGFCRNGRGDHSGCTKYGNRRSDCCGCSREKNCGRRGFLTRALLQGGKQWRRIPRKEENRTNDA